MSQIKEVQELQRKMFEAFGSIVLLAGALGRSSDSLDLRLSLEAAVNRLGSLQIEFMAARMRLPTLQGR